MDKHTYFNRRAACFFYLPGTLFSNLSKESFFYLFASLSLATKYPAAPIFALPFVNKRTVLRSPRIWLMIYLLVIGVIICFISLKFNFGTARFFLPWIAFRVSRYSLPLYPAILMFAAYGGFMNFSFLKKGWPNRTILLTMVFSSILVYAIAVYSIRGYAVTDINSKTFVGYKEAGAFLTKQDGEQSILTSSHRQIKYFAPEFTVYDLPKYITFKESQRLIKEKEIDFFL